MVHSKKMAWIWINVLGGAAVIGSYIYGFLAYPNAAEGLWGGVPAGFRPYYSVGMVLAAVGYLVVSFFLLRLDESETRISNRFGFGIFNVLYLIILIPSAFWMPLTLLAMGKASPVWTGLVKVDLAFVAGGSLGLLYAILNSWPRRSAASHLIAVLSCVGFCFQTVILDAIVWSFFFRVGAPAARLLLNIIPTLW